MIQHDLADTHSSVKSILGFGITLGTGSLAWVKSFDVGATTSSISLVCAAIAGGIVMISAGWDKRRSAKAETDRRIREADAESARKIREDDADTERKIEEKLGNTVHRKLDQALTSLNHATEDRARLEKTLADQNVKEAKLESMLAEAQARAERLFSMVRSDNAQTRKSVKAIERKVGPDRILLIEDHEDNRNATSKLFSSSGYEVMTAGTVAEARAILRDDAKAQSLTFVLLDLMLPDGDGTEILDKIKMRGLNCYVVVLTGMADGETLDATYALFPDLTLRKPVPFSELHEKLQTLKEKTPRPRLTDWDMPQVKPSSGEIPTVP